ncbi:Rieske (2Fe-2S) protein [Magnetospira sp. QH-2]|uniref:Rieske (2Fe-2S) protein n=1 Tax=Magnetospira sp. (strain QH-2) TaxID=1288970 RepID=UPI0003E816B7|nr:Rieske (2Fe-2S) protein [Magnetospira sp. QH-2]CCQ75381.1 conserved protein of unknown function[Include Rieske [2Fe-2S] domain] [Magnetospira sp. QH-2]
MSDTALCALADLESPGSLAAIATVEGARTAIMIIRKDDKVYGYVNSCPHIGAPLDLQEGQFLSLDKTRILCSTHGAHFRIGDGVCLTGPCEGKGLTPVSLTVQDGEVFVSSSS